MAESMAYIGRKKCGCVVAVAVDDPESPKQTAKDVAEFIASGLTVERVACQFVRENPFGCQHEKGKRSAKQSEFSL